MNTPTPVSPAWWIEVLAAARTWAAAQIAAAEGAAAAACAAGAAERTVLWTQVQAALPLAVREALAAALTAAPDPPEVRLEIDGQPYTLRWGPAAAAGTPGHWCLAGDQPAWKPTAVIAPEHLLAELLGRWDAAYGGDPPVTSALAPTLAAARAYQTRKVRQERARARRARADFSTRLAAAVAPYPDLLPRLALRVRHLPGAPTAVYGRFRHGAIQGTVRRLPGEDAAAGGAEDRWELTLTGPRTALPPLPRPLDPVALRHALVLVLGADDPPAWPEAVDPTTDAPASGDP